MRVVGAARRSPRPMPFHDGLIARGRLPKLALVAALSKLLHAAYSVTKNRQPFTLQPIEA